MVVVMKMVRYDYATSPPEVYEDYGFVIIFEASKKQVTKILKKLGFTHDSETNIWSYDLEDDTMIEVFLEEVPQHRIVFINRNVATLGKIIGRIIEKAINEK